MEVIGIRPVSFPDKKDPTKMVGGVTLYCAHPLKDEEGEGYFYNKDGKDRVFLSDWFIDKRMGGVIPRLHDIVSINYDRDGKLQSVLITEMAK